jgi:NitT/TauT family transport system ATP-binding protein
VTHSSNDLALRVSSLEVSFVDSDGSLEVLDKISFSVERNAFVCIVGPSGGGKSTLLRAVAGLIQPTGGTVEFPGAEEGKSRTGLVFQKPNLLPWRTLQENISLPLEIARRPEAEIAAFTQEMIHLVGLEGFEKSYPHELSGGMAQRAAIARCLVQDPEILLLDEPFGQLDALTRDRMGDELLRIWNERRKTVLMVTHSIAEAIFLADRVLVLTSRPAHLTMDLPIRLSRPRTDAMRYLPEFTEASRLLREQLKSSIAASS